MNENVNLRLVFRATPSLVEVDRSVIPMLALADLPPGGGEPPTTRPLLPGGGGEPGTIRGIIADGAPMLDLTVRREEAVGDLRRFIQAAEREVVVIVDRTSAEGAIRTIISRLGDIASEVLVVERHEP